MNCASIIEHLLKSIVKLWKRADSYKWTIYLENEILEINYYNERKQMTYEILSFTFLINNITQSHSLRSHRLRQASRGAAD